MPTKVSVCVYTEYSNNDIADVYTFETDNLAKHVAHVGAYMLMRSIKSNGFGRGKVGVVNLSYYSDKKHNHILCQMVLRDDGLVEFIKPNFENHLYKVDSYIWNSLVKNGFEFCFNNGIVL